MTAPTSAADLAGVARADGLACAIGAFASGLNAKQIPAEVIADVELALDFNLGIARAGHSHLGGLGERWVRGGGAATEATVWVSGTRGSAERVAFANALAAHARAQDDFQHSAHCHIGAVVAPAVLALAEMQGSPGPELIVALAIGYQVASVLGSPVAWRTSAKGLRATPLYGPLGGAVACARLLGADAAETAAALALAANTGSGFNHAWAEGTHEWRLQVGNASASSLRCAQLAMLGAHAGPHTLEGRHGFFAVHAGEEPDVEALAAELADWRMADVQIKPRPVCGINQGPAATAAEIAASHDFDAGLIASVRMRMRPEDVAYPGIVNHGPFNGPGTALMSTPFVVATALLTGDVGFAALEPPYDDRVLALARRVHIEADDTLPELGHVLAVTDTAGNEHVREYLEPDGSGALTRGGVDETLQRVAGEVGDPAVASVERRTAIEALAGGGDVGTLLGTLL